MVFQRLHYTLSHSALGVQTLLLALLAVQATALAYPLANSRRLSGATLPGASQVTAFCKVYSTGLACTSCIRNYFLQGGVCVPVPQANLIAGCNVYSSNTTCAVCDNGSFLSANNTACQTATGAANCLAYLNNTACLSCPNGYALANFACTVIPNCSQSNGTVCTACAAGYYLNSTGVCLQLVNGTTIANCAAYLSNGSCARCAAGFVADASGLSCLSGALVDNQLDPLCIDQRVQNGNFCSVCRQGYSLVNGQCQLIQNSETCLIYDPSSASNCLVCMSGYSMLSLTGGCQANSVPSTGIVDPVGSAAIPTLAKVLLLVVVSAHFA